MFSFKQLTIFIFVFFSPLFLFSQPGEFYDLIVSKFDAPYSEMTVTVYGSELPVIVNDQTKITGAKNVKITPNKVTEGTVIEKLKYELNGSSYTAKEVKANISLDNSVEVYGLFEGMRGDLAVVDGYLIRLRPGVKVEGSNKKKKCDCKGLITPGFNSPLIKPGNFYVTIEGEMSKEGIVEAESAELCKNTFGKAEQELISAVSGNYEDNTKKLTNTPPDLTGLYMSLYNGEVKVGQYRYMLANDIGLQGYVNRVGHRVLPQRLKKKQMEQGPVYYRFYVIEDQVPNAFAFPNGMIFVHTGLLDIIDNEAQLAAVLGHEIAHVTHEHGRERYESTGILGDLTNVADDLFKETVKINIDTENVSPAMMESINQVSSAITPAAISNVIKPQTKMESQADRVGIHYAYNAGYDIREAVKFWNKMATLTGDPSFQAKVTQDLLNSLNSDRLDLEDGDLKSQLSGIAGQVAAKQVLDTIYTSHPKAKTRSQDINKLIGTVYQDADWSSVKVREDKYQAAIGR